MNKKYSVLTYIFGDNYERVHEIQYKNPEIEYILITDNHNLKSDTWTVVYDESLKNLSVFDKCYKVRFHLFDYVHTDYVLRIDGSVEIMSDVMDIFTLFVNGNYDLMLMINPVHNLLINDYAQWIRWRNYSQASAKKCIDFIQSMNYDFRYKGYYQLNCILEKRCKTVEDVNNLTYSFLKYLGDENNIERFDQPIYSFVLNKFFENRLNILPVSEDLVTNSKYLQWYWHNSDVKIPHKTDVAEPYLFNKKVETINI